MFTSWLVHYHCKMKKEKGLGLAIQDYKAFEDNTYLK